MSWNARSLRRVRLGPGNANQLTCGMMSSHRKMFEKQLLQSRPESQCHQAEPRRIVRRWSRSIVKPESDWPPGRAGHRWQHLKFNCADASVSCHVENHSITLRSPVRTPSGAAASTLLHVKADGVNLLFPGGHKPTGLVFRLGCLGKLNSRAHQP